MKKSFNFKFFPIISLILFLSLNQQVLAKNLKVMTYNVENLFDTIHDLGKTDYAYLPLNLKQSSSEIQLFCSEVSNPYYRDSCFNMDWNDRILKSKIANIAKVIKSQNPDIIVLEEVENKHVLTQLRDLGLQGLGYQIILIEGSDLRGIDVGILSKYPLAHPAQLHYVDTPSIDNNGKPDKQTRGILEANFLINGKTITIFGNHWPSQSHPDTSRLLAGKTLYKSINSQDDLVLALGDFNTSSDNQRSGIDQYLLNSINPFTFVDAEAYFFELNPNSNNHRGTHMHKGRWGSLDHIFVLNNSNKIIPLWNSFKVVALEEILTINHRNEVVPFRFDTKTGNGYSDHLPLVLTFEL